MCHHLIEKESDLSRKEGGNNYTSDGVGIDHIPFTAHYSRGVPEGDISIH